MEILNKAIEKKVNIYAYRSMICFNLHRSIFTSSLGSLVVFNGIAVRSSQNVLGHV